MDVPYGTTTSVSETVPFPSVNIVTMKELTNLRKDAETVVSPVTDEGTSDHSSNMYTYSDVAGEGVAVTIVLPIYSLFSDELTGVP